jgi:hypothetical protein
MMIIAATRGESTVIDNTWDANIFILFQVKRFTRRGGQKAKGKTGKKSRMFPAFFGF